MREPGTTERIKVLELIDTSELGGGQVHLLGLLRRIDGSSFEVSVCATEASPFGRAVRDLDLILLPVDVKLLMNPLSFFRLVRQLKGGKIDILHLHGGVAGMWGRLAAILAGTPVVIYTCHGLHFLYKRRLVSRWFIALVERWLSARNDAIIFVSEHDKWLGATSGVLSGGSVRVIRNGIEPSLYQESGAVSEIKGSLGIPEGTPVFGCVGRLHRQKGHAVLLAALRGLVGKHPGVRLLLVGDGPLRGELEEKARQWGLGGNVIFCGFRKDVPELLAVMDLFILASYWEGFPISLLEAMAAGVPVIAARIGGVTEIVKEGMTGALFSAGCHEELLALMTRFLASKRDFREMAEKAKEVVLSSFTLEGMAKETMAFMVEVYEGRVASKRC